MLTLDQWNPYLGMLVLALVGGMVVLLMQLLTLQRRQLRVLETCLEEQRAMAQRQLAAEQARLAEAQAATEAQAAREQQVVVSRQSMADAVATLRQLKRHFG